MGKDHQGIIASKDQIDRHPGLLNPVLRGGTVRLLAAALFPYALQTVLLRLWSHLQQVQCPPYGVGRIFHPDIFLINSRLIGKQVFVGRVPVVIPAVGKSAVRRVDNLHALVVCL